ncbi:esterase/lipase family protein [Actinomadura rupiterrae]|uniref:esterase/lipase family protein n=1 Tax=Actinomadura rupiterrae TaxID=559627 RepID=UPI0020A3A0B7|nr:alpha/beta fold hydrolase [Actinomadura rupiterrae]MCP2338932.1 triacylglycerol esterase/lipase EstA (alpha/beta hydrolase family) [Actinomadura rupiterrae]
MPQSRRTSLRRAVIGTATAATLSVSVMTPAEAAEYPVGHLSQAVSNFFFSPGRVAGANTGDCRPSAAHPTPVVLVHATGVNLGANWVTVAPTLANAGYCVYAFNYGMTALSAGRIGGMGDIPTSARTLAAFVDQVRAATGSAQVDLVGHSQGGMMPNYYIKRLGGAAKVRRFVAIAPSNHGTTLSGLVDLGTNLGVLGFTNFMLTLAGAPSLVQQQSSSAFIKGLFGDGDTVPGPRYTVIETVNDHVVTPYTNAFLSGPNVRDVTIQKQCPNDPVGHIGMFEDGPTVQNVANALGPDDPNFQPECSDYGTAL